MPALPEPGQPFAEPWHAELVATTHALAGSGTISWPEWSDAFGAALADDLANGGPTDGSRYYEIWLRALEGFLVECGVADRRELADRQRAWREAYLATPHGSPVVLGSD